MKREVAGSRGATKEWTLVADRVVLLEDDEVPAHKSPIKYSASFLDGNGKKTAVRIISLQGWQPGVVVSSTTASKGSAPKLSKAGRLETSLAMSGQGRHYLDIYLRPGVRLSSQVAVGSDLDGNPDPSNIVSIGMVGEDEFGMEVEIEGECFSTSRSSGPSQRMSSWCGSNYPRSKQAPRSARAISNSS